MLVGANEGGAVFLTIPIDASVIEIEEDVLNI